MKDDSKTVDFGKDNVLSILLKLAPSVMFAQLIQALYNIVDSFFIGKFSEEGLTALSIVYPLQLLMIALAVGTGVGINTLMARFLGIKEVQKSEEMAGVGTFLAFIMWVIFAIICWFLMPFYAHISTSSELVAEYVITYGRIVCVFSMGLFFESIWTKILQAYGNMKLPMIAQIVGALINIVLDPILIFNANLGIAGAGIATAIGQVSSALIVMTKGYRKSPSISVYKKYIKRIYYFGFPNILMQSAYTFYILGFNLILKGFSDQAVTVLGLYYKWQTFFIIPLTAMQTCIVPVVSFNYSAEQYDRCKKTLKDAVFFGFILMSIGILCFELIPSQLLRVFSKDIDVITIGTHAFRVIGVSFIPIVTSLIFPVYFQAIGSSVKSSFLTVLRTVVLFVPLGWILSKFGLNQFWLTFPVTDSICTLVGYIIYKKSSYGGISIKS